MAKIDKLYCHVDKESMNEDVLISYDETLEAFKTQKVVHTAQLSFLRLYNANQVFVVVEGKCYELTEGHCVGTDKEIRLMHNLENMLMSGAFDFYRKREK